MMQMQGITGSIVCRGCCIEEMNWAADSNTRETLKKKAVKGFPGLVRGRAWACCVGTGAVHTSVLVCAGTKPLRTGFLKTRERQVSRTRFAGCQDW